MSKEFRGLNALKLRTVMKKRKKWRSEAFIEETENEGDVIPPKYWRKNLDRWIRTLPLDVWSVTQPKVFNDASRVPKRQKQL